MRIRIGLFIVLVLAPASRLSAWSYKEHILFTRIAALRLVNDPSTPPEMKAWLQEAGGELPDMAGIEQYYMTTRVGLKPQGFTGLSQWAWMPDFHAQNDPAESKVDPFNVHEKLLHYIDLELLVPGDGKKIYRHDLANKPKLEDVRRVMSDARYAQAGLLPFRIEQCYNRLVQSIRAGRLHAPTPEEQEEKTATYWAGYLAHYLADNTQPHHATIDYKSQSYFPARPAPPNIHSEVEYRMCDDEKNDYMALRKEYWPMFVALLDNLEDPIRTTDPWQASVEVSLLSYDALPLIGTAASRAGPLMPFNTEAFFRFRGQFMGRDMSVLEMKAIQTAWAVRRIQATWRQAWDEAKVISLRSE